VKESAVEITQFKMVRPPRRHEDEETLRLPDARPIAPRPGRTPRLQLLYKPPTTPPLMLTLATLPDIIGSAGDDPLSPVMGNGAAPILARVYHLLHHLDRFLARRNDRVEGEELDPLVTTLEKAYQLDQVDWSTLLCGPADVHAGYTIALLGLRGALRAAMQATPPDFERAALLCRRTLIAGLLESWALGGLRLSADDIVGYLGRRNVVLDGLTAAELAPAAQVELIREAQVADLQVVRREWAGYLAGEIANIRNVMKGEDFGTSDKTTRESELTTEQTRERRELEEHEDQSKLDSELTQEVDAQLAIAINGHAEASAEFKYPVVTARVSGGIDAGMSLQRSERQASKIAREAVSRALSRVDTMTRESRVRRELTRSEQGVTCAFDNRKGENVHGVYRWVDRVDTYQLFRYPDRLLLEMQIPEPAEFYRWRTERRTQGLAAEERPPAWDLTLADISPAQLVPLAAKYRASNLPAPPDPTVAVVRTVTVEASKEAIPQTNVTLWNAPPATKEIDVPIPTDYAAVKVRYEGQGFPILTKWALPGGGELPGYRSAFASVSIGHRSTLYWNGGIANKGRPDLAFKTTHGTLDDPGIVTEVQSELPPYGRALLTIGADVSIDPTPVEVTIDPPAINIVKIAVTTVGVSACTLTMLVECKLTAEAQAAWQLGIYDALYAAWAQWNKEYASAQVRDALIGASTASDVGSSQRNELVIREELKRAVIGWLLDEVHFAGRPALRPAPATDFADIDVPKARADAATIQFLEQAFEWNNLTYVFYPYYWARREDWEKRSQIVANDPEFERFLRCGSARVIVSARPGFDDAVRNWLLYRVPFISGQLPSPDDPLYISLDKEIREITSPWEGGIPGDTWQARVTTTLLYLEKEGDLPFANDRHQLPAPEGIPFVPKAYIELPPN
jgi:hypothetical protein